ncbi:hypothetical protein SEA_DATBOI_56 [Gordonia phage DatBoi]|nr:hypothetical protein SEA_DATBOI_56 [Gordonia phage DatBoi]
MTEMWPYTRVEGLWQYIDTTWEQQINHERSVRAIWRYLFNEEPESGSTHDDLVRRGLDAQYARTAAAFAEEWMTEMEHRMYHYETPHMIWDNPIFPPRDRPVEVPYVPGALHTTSGRAMVGLDKPWWLEQVEAAQALFPDRSTFERVLQVAKRGWISGRRSDAC